MDFQNVLTKIPDSNFANWVIFNLKSYLRTIVRTFVFTKVISKQFLKFPRKTLITGFNNLDMKVAIERDHVDALAHALIISLMGSKVILQNFVVALQTEYYP